MRRIFCLFATMLAMAALASAASAQATSSFSPSGGITLAVSSSSSRVALPAPAQTALITNTGSASAYLNFGGSAVAATTAGYTLSPGCSSAYDVKGQSDVAAITASGTTALSIIIGSGLPTLPPTGCSIAASISGSTGALTDGSGTVTTGGVSQQVFAANPSRKYFFVENPRSTTEDLFVNFTSAASTTDGKSIDLGPGGSFWLEGSFISTEAINVTAGSTAHPFIAKEGQ